MQGARGGRGTRGECSCRLVIGLLDSRCVEQAAVRAFLGTVYPRVEGGRGRASKVAKGIGN